jgi:hypothetical protein
MFPLFASKTERFVRHYKQFTTEFTENYPTYDSDDRDSVRIQYRVLREKAKEFEPDMTNAERAEIDSCNYKINAVMIKESAGNAANKVGNFLNEVAGTIKEVLKTE